MPKFFVDYEVTKENKTIVLQGSNAHHLQHVLRCNLGDEITVCGSNQIDCQVKITGLNKDMIEGCIIACKDNQAETPYQLELFQCLPKGKKMDEIIQKTVELGIFALTPCLSARSLVKIDEKASRQKVERWQKIAEAAAKQSGRGVIPEIRQVLSFQQAIEKMQQAAIAFIPWENESSMSLQTFINQAKFKALPKNTSIAYMIGPEGGFSEAEMMAAKTQQLATVSLGTRILRTETAGPAIAAMMVYRFEA